ncbi:MAG: helix-turn-helix domain-containing protein [Planctomycetota bacterium]|jgi:transcriptional regulator with XRE-family HTH domain
MSQFGTLVRKLRREKGMTLEQVARRIGSHKGYVSGIENGKVNPPSVKFIRKFARIFKYDEREMIRIAYVDKAPGAIRDEIRTLVFSGRSRGTPSKAAPVVEIPLLNTVDTGYSTKINGGGRVEPVVGATLIVPRTGTLPAAAATVCDKSMEQAEGISFPQGSVVLLSPMEKIRNGTVAFVVYSRRDRKVASIRQIMLEENKNVVLQPLNKSNPLEFVTQDDIDAVYAVIGKIEAVNPAPKTVTV